MEKAQDAKLQGEKSKPLKLGKKGWFDFSDFQNNFKNKIYFNIKRTDMLKIKKCIMLGIKNNLKRVLRLK